MGTESTKNALYYRLSFGNIIAYKGQQPPTLQLKQGSQKVISDGSKSYYLLLRGVKVNRQIYRLLQKSTRPGRASRTSLIRLRKRATSCSNSNSMRSRKVTSAILREKMTSIMNQMRMTMRWKSRMTLRSKHCSVNVLNT